MSRAAIDLTKPAAAFVTPVETAIRADLTVGEALNVLRSRKIEQRIIYFYVLDEEDRLIGVVPTRRLLLAEPGATIRSIMHTPVVSVTSDTPLELVLEEFAMRRLLAIPVVDEGGRLQGVVDVQVYTEETVDLAESNRLADMYQLLGVRLEEARQRSAIKAFGVRMPWLLCNISGGLICAAIAGVFKDTLAAAVALAMFIPVVLTLSESISMQSMTLSLQLLHRADVPWARVIVRARTEWRTAMLLGLASAVLVGLASLLWSDGRWMLGAVVGVSITGSMVASGMFGILVPVALHALKLDPRVAAGPVVLTLADVLTTTAYLGLATWWLL